MAIAIKKISQNTNILPVSASSLVATKNMTRNFGQPEDYVEMHIADPSGKVVLSLTPFTNYTVPSTFVSSSQIHELTFDPATDISNAGIQFGSYTVTYNIFRPKVIASYLPNFFIKEISGDRTEIRLSSNTIPEATLTAGTTTFINEFQSTPYFKEFYLNFGRNNIVPAINIALDLNTNPDTILIKLINPLPAQYAVNNTLSIVDEISNQQIFEADVTIDPVVATYPTLRGPNFDLDLDSLRVGSTPYYNFNQITSSQPGFATLQTLLGQVSASNFNINIDYTDYENFVHFSSAARRLEGFKYKITNIQTYTANSASLATSTSPTAQLDALAYQNKINSIIQSFDGYEQYLYFESSSYTWPKTTSTKPYINALTSSATAVNWYNGNHDSASLYDDNNQNYILYTLPSYITENTDNESAFKFAASIGQMFDDVWIHIKAITDLYQSKNALTQGISKDLVYFALQSLGVNVYTDQDGKDVFQYLYGTNANGGYLPVTSSYQTLVSASNYQLSGQDQQKSIYKRLYHNLPLLLKSKGTTRFIQYLNTVFGIPDTVMSYVEYGGVDKVSSSFEYEYDRFTYALNVSGSNTITVPWNYTSQSKARTGNNDIVPNGIEFRFKASPSYASTQSLFYSGSNFQLQLIYTNTGSVDSIYSGSTGNFGYVKFFLSNPVSPSLYVTSSTIPVFTTGSNGDTNWYNVLVQRRYPDKQLSDIGDPQFYDVYVKNNTYGEIGHVASASLYFASSPLININWYREGGMKFGGGSTPFSGSIQEIRLWSNYISESAFDFHVLNPESIEGNYTSSAFNDLTARYPLGNNLYTYNHSLTGNVASTAPDQAIQSFTASFASFPNRNNYTSFTETYYANAANSGYANPVTDKVRIPSGSTYGTQLLPNKSIEIQPTTTITKDIHLLDAGLSPQDEIDRDIIAQLGSLYNVDDIIGNPSGTGYSELDTLRTDYFKKYVNKYNYKDYISLIDYFHNSLFKTLKDFTPARTDLVTGITIRPHLLERSNEEIIDPSAAKHNNYSESIDLLSITGSNPGGYTFPVYNFTQSTNVGPVILQSDDRDFFTGVLSGSLIDYYTDFITKNDNPYTRYNQDQTSSYSQSVWNVSYNPTLNNVSTAPTSSLINKQTLLNGVALSKTSVYVTESIQFQDFTYDYTRHVNGRYDGSTSTSYTFTDYTPASGSYVGDKSYGLKAAIDNFDSCIYEFNFGGGGYPENSYGGTFSMGNIYLIGKDRDDVFIIPPDDDNYYWFLDRAFYHLNTIKQKSYGATNGLNARIQSLYSGVVLEDASYWISSYYNPIPNGVYNDLFYVTGSLTYPNTPYVKFYETSQSVDLYIPLGTRVGSTQQTGSLAVNSTAMIEISSSLVDGDRWFVSLYEADGVNTSLGLYSNKTGLKNIADGSNLFQVGYPFEIDRIERITSGSNNISFIIFKDTPNTILNFVSPISYVPGISNYTHIIGAAGSSLPYYLGYGMLLTKGVPSNQVVMYGDKWQNFSVTSGYATTLYPKPLITQEAKYITSTYGNRP